MNAYSIKQKKKKKKSINPVNLVWSETCNYTFNSCLDDVTLSHVNITMLSGIFESNARIALNKVTFVRFVIE